MYIYVCEYVYKSNIYIYIGIFGRASELLCRLISASNAVKFTCTSPEYKKRLDGIYNIVERYQYICMYINLCMYTCKHTYLCIYLYTHIYVYVYIYIYEHNFKYRKHRLDDKLKKIQHITKNENEKTDKDNFIYVKKYIRMQTLSTLEEPIEYIKHIMYLLSK
jgi:hypothetical protein